MKLVLPLLLTLLTLTLLSSTTEGSIVGTYASPVSSSGCRTVLELDGLTFYSVNSGPTSSCGTGAFLGTFSFAGGDSTSPAAIVVTYALIPSSASSMFTVGDAVTYLTTLSGDSLRLVNAERSIDVVFSRVAASSTPDFVKGVRVLFPQAACTGGCWRLSCWCCASTCAPIPIPIPIHPFPFPFPNFVLHPPPIHPSTIHVHYRTHSTNSNTGGM